MQQNDSARHMSNPFRCDGTIRLGLRGLPILLACACVPLLPPGARADDTTIGTVASVDAVNKTVTLMVPQRLNALSAGDASAKAVLDSIAAGDTVQLSIATDGKSFTNLSKASVTVGAASRVVALAVCGGFLLVMAMLASSGRLLAFIVGADNRYSNSKTQLALWSATVFTVYLATLLLRVIKGGDWSVYLGGVEIPGNLAALSGLSALSFAGATAVTAQKASAAAAQNTANHINITAGRAQAVPEKTRAAVPSLLTDLFQNDNSNVDIGDFQMILITVVAVALYIARSFAFLGHIELSTHVMMPDVDSTLLAGFGIGQGAYLAKKAASAPGQG